jgi:hypothetical protein
LRVFDGNDFTDGLVEKEDYNWLAIPEEKITAYRERIESAPDVRAASLS